VVDLTSIKRQRLSFRRCNINLDASGEQLVCKQSVASPPNRRRFMLGRACVSVLLIATGCASRSRLKPFSPNLNIPLGCVTSIPLVDCDLSSIQPHCRTAAVAYRKGCEQVVVVVK